MRIYKTNKAYYYKESILKNKVVKKRISKEEFNKIKKRQTLTKKGGMNPNVDNSNGPVNNVSNNGPVNNVDNNNGSKEILFETIQRLTLTEINELFKKNNHKTDLKELFDMYFNKSAFNFNRKYKVDIYFEKGFIGISNREITANQVIDEIYKYNRYKYINIFLNCLRILKMLSGQLTPVNRNVSNLHGKNRQFFNITDVILRDKHLFQAFQHNFNQIIYENVTVFSYKLLNTQIFGSIRSTIKHLILASDQNYYVTTLKKINSGKYGEIYECGINPHLCIKQFRHPEDKVIDNVKKVLSTIRNTNKDNEYHLMLYRPLCNISYPMNNIGDDEVNDNSLLILMNKYDSDLKKYVDDYSPDIITINSILNILMKQISTVNNISGMFTLDLKPENVLVNYDFEYNIIDVKLCDLDGFVINDELVNTPGYRNVFLKSKVANNICIKKKNLARLSNLEKDRLLSWYLGLIGLYCIMQPETAGFDNPQATLQTYIQAQPSNQSHNIMNFLNKISECLTPDIKKRRPFRNKNGKLNFFIFF